MRDLPKLNRSRERDAQSPWVPLTSTASLGMPQAGGLGGPSAPPSNYYSSFEYVLPDNLSGKTLREEQARIVLSHWPWHSGSSWRW